MKTNNLKTNNLETNSFERKNSHIFSETSPVLFVCFVVVLYLFVVQTTSSGGTKSNCVMVNDPLFFEVNMFFSKDADRIEILKCDRQTDI